ncbi:MAG: NAD-dependent epimerase/dehydratase family protein [Planctomycetota bacterium]
MAVPAGVRLFRVDLQDRAATAEALLECRPEAVFHFAANCYVGGSVTDPGKCHRIISTSTSATRCSPPGLRPSYSARPARSTACRPRDHRGPVQAPINPCGRTKLHRGLLDDHAVAPRPAAACGCATQRRPTTKGPRGRSAPDRPETHLIPLDVLQVALGQRQDIGSSAPTTYARRHLRLDYIPSSTWPRATSASSSRKAMREGRILGEAQLASAAGPGTRSARSSRRRDA